MNEKPRNLIYTCPVDHAGTSVFVKGWVAENNERPPLVIAHDLGQTADEFEALAGIFVGKGFNVYCYDMRGHGQSTRRIGHISSISQLAQDLLQVLAWIKFQEGGRRPIVLAQGMGALVALFFSRSHGKFCSRMVLGAPLLSLGEVIKPSRRFLIRTIAEFFPSMGLPSALRPVFTYANGGETQPTPKVSAFFAHELLQAMAQGKKLLQRVSVPTLILCPQLDKACRYEGLRRGISKQKNADLFTIIDLNNSEHRIFSQSEAKLPAVVSTIIQWLDNDDDSSLVVEENVDDLISEPQSEVCEPEVGTNSRAVL